jgi:hypothetical protein
MKPGGYFSRNSFLSGAFAVISYRFFYRAIYRISNGAFFIVAEEFAAGVGVKQFLGVPGNQAKHFIKIIH